MEHRTGQMDRSRQLAISWQAWVPEGEPRAVVIVAHGLAEHAGRYAHVAERLTAGGLAVYAPDHRGHGRSGGQRAQIDRLDEVVDDLHAFAGLVRAEQAGRPQFLLGHSMGGAIALAYALRYQDELAGLVLSAPAVLIEGTSPVQVRVGKILAEVVPGYGLLRLDGTAVSRDSEVVRAYDTDPLNYRGKIPARTLAELVRFAERLPARLPSLRLPVLVMQGTADRLVPAGAGRFVHDGVSSADRTLRVYDGLYHEVFNEPERETVLADLVDWLDRHLPPG